MGEARQALQKSTEARSQAESVASGLRSAAEAQRVIVELNEESNRLRTTASPADGPAAATAVALPAAPFDFSGYDADLEQSDAAPSTAQALLEHGRKAVEEVGRSMGYEHELDPGVIAGQVHLPRGEAAQVALLPRKTVHPQGRPLTPCWAAGGCQQPGRPGPYT
ncbi:hypothetical protein ACIA8F_08495 [Streptomyces sp. NPDC051563]|uniref:hypothetical protein n=1 Tax=Streptomyces sp. NPDC051563 TaxID=3365659 RepID=UPI0037B12548